MRCAPRCSKMAGMTRGRTLLERRLQPFLKRHQLLADWHSDRLLRLEPHPGTGGARAVIDLADGFWEAFEAESERIQERVLQELLMRLAGPYVPNRQGEALVVLGGLRLIESARNEVQKKTAAAPQPSATACPASSSSAFTSAE
jgi:hypothetical protein